MKGYKGLLISALLSSGVYADKIVECKNSIPDSIIKLLEGEINSGKTNGSYVSEKGSISYFTNDNNIQVTFAGENGAGNFNCKIKDSK